MQVYYVILRNISQLKKIYHYYANLGLAANSDIPYCQKTLSRMQVNMLYGSCEPHSKRMTSLCCSYGNY